MHVLKGRPELQVGRATACAGAGEPMPIASDRANDYDEAMVLAGWHVAFFLGVIACSPYGGGAYHCDRDDQCTGGGICQPVGLCSFADPSCTSGQRYGGLSGGLSNVCVGEEPVDAGIDVQTNDGVTDSAIDGPPPGPFCDTGNAALAGCWEFEGTTNDGSGHNHNATAQNTTFTANGKVGMGIVLQANSLVAVADDNLLSPPNLTLEAFVRPTSLPTGGARMGVYDNDSSYGLFITDAGGVSCTVSVSVAVATSIVPINAWTHIACTFDGSTGRLYINGAEVAMTSGGSPLGNGNGNGSVIGGNSPNGSQLVGTIDQVRVWNTARTASQVCTASGAPLCP